MKPQSKPHKLFNVISIRVDSKERTQTNSYPMTHREAVTFKSKLSEFDHRILILEEA